MTEKAGSEKITKRNSIHHDFCLEMPFDSGKFNKHLSIIRYVFHIYMKLPSNPLYRYIGGVIKAEW